MNVMPKHIRTPLGTPLRVRGLQPTEMHAVLDLRMRDARAQGAGGNVEYLCRDALDPFAHHLVVEGEGGALLGAARVLAPADALSAGGSFVEALFNLGAWREAPPSLELSWPVLAAGPDRLAVAALLIEAVLRYARRLNLAHLLLCVHLSPTELGALRCGGAPVWMPALLRMRPWAGTPSLTREARGEVSPWVGRLLVEGARVCGEPAWDPALRRAVLPMWLEIGARTSRRCA
ncbi:hypothetical protein HUS23_02870 [Ectothiorhodospiraceae bacterium 2226]|nr:hypothetical protein HUS23_02870 [Ectothiorhodospiraceae bacterium 2226]